MNLPLSQFIQSIVIAETESGFFLSVLYRAHGRIVAEELKEDLTRAVKRYIKVNGLGLVSFMEDNYDDKEC